MSKTQQQLVTDWNAKHPVGTEVQVGIINGHKCVTTEEAHLNEEQFAFIKIKIEGVCDATDWRLDKLEAIANEGE